MRAVVVHEFGPIDSHGLEDVPDPTPGPEDVLVEVDVVLDAAIRAPAFAARKSIGKTVLTTGRDG